MSHRDPASGERQNFLTMRFYEAIPRLAGIGMAAFGVLVAGLYGTAVVLSVTSTERAATETAGVSAAVLLRGATTLDDRLTGAVLTTAPKSAKALKSHFEELGYTLANVRDGNPVPRIYLTSLPADLAEMKSVADRKAAFIRAMLPLVLARNEEIRADRARLKRILNARRAGQPVEAADRAFLRKLTDAYGVNYGEWDELVRRIDIVPPALAIAQAAEESGWGTSRFAREGNALYGQWTFSGKGLLPAGRENGKNHRIRAFDRLSSSVIAYMRNLNTHRAYRGFRKARAEMRARGETPTGNALAARLKSYSQRGEAYVASLRTIMRVNSLNGLDRAFLAEPRIALTDDG